MFIDTSQRTPPASDDDAGGRECLGCQRDEQDASHDDGSFFVPDIVVDDDFRDRRDHRHGRRLSALEVTP